MAKFAIGQRVRLLDGTEGEIIEFRGDVQGMAYLVVSYAPGGTWGTRGWWYDGALSDAAPAGSPPATAWPEPKEDGGGNV